MKRRRVDTGADEERYELRSRQNRPFSLQTLPADLCVTLADLFECNGTRSSLDEKPCCSTCAKYPLPGFEHVGDGTESVVYDAREFVIKIPRDDFHHPYYPGMRWQSELIMLSEKASRQVRGDSCDDRSHCRHA